MAVSKGHSAHFHTITQHFPRRIRQDARDLVKLFLSHKTKRISLPDAFLGRVWECSRATVQRRLTELERLGLIRRLTFPPKKEGGRWTQHRIIHLITVSHSVSLIKKAFSKPFENKPAANSKLPALSFKDWLSLRQDVPIGAWLFWCRKWGAKPSTLGHLRRVWELIQHRADILEEVLWAADHAGFKDRRRVAFVVSEVKARV